jgi:SH3-like domain-containing protein
VHRFVALRLILDIYPRVGENEIDDMTISSRRQVMIRRGKFILIMVFVSLYVVFSGFADTPKTMSVQVKEGQLRSTPSFLAEIIAKPAYGDRVEIIQDQGPWKKVAIRGVQGWMHTTALTTKSIVLKAGATNVQTSATGSEIALAGKGFSEEVEKQYKNLNRNLDYAWVDRMEKFKVSPEQMQAFLKQGNVIPVEGGVQ